MLKNQLFVGSSFTGIFKKSRFSRTYLWKILGEKFQNLHEVFCGERYFQCDL